MKGRSDTLFILLALLGGCEMRSNAATEELDTISHLTVLIDNREYSIDVTESNVEGVNRSLAIKCNSGCEQIADYRARVVGFPVGMFRLTDAHSFVVVTFGGATFTLVQVFQLDADGIRLVFNRRTAGTLMVSEYNARLAIGTQEYTSPPSSLPRQLTTTTWVWNGNEFAQSAD